MSEAAAFDPVADDESLGGPAWCELKQARVQHAAEALLTALDIDVTDPALRETPRRVAEMYRELLTPAPFTATTFANEAGYDELVLARSVPFTSLCAHHLLPFRGVAHVGYLPGDRLLGLSKLARLVQFYARGPQVQERLTKQVADWLREHLGPRGVGVVLEAEHQCMTIRGVQAAGATTFTSTMYGLLRDNPPTRAEFLALVG
ncbi:MAG TPA: GTP cyclohydrolase I FolE [Frankiaceae bacterium]|nr:GTP cyclohydrolase I FolE [Frankiaceae bacterium]